MKHLDDYERLYGIDPQCYHDAPDNLSKFGKLGNRFVVVGESVLPLLEHLVQARYSGLPVFVITNRATDRFPFATAYGVLDTDNVDDTADLFTSLGHVFSAEHLLNTLDVLCNHGIPAVLIYDRTFLDDRLNTGLTERFLNSTNDYLTVIIGDYGERRMDYDELEVPMLLTEDTARAFYRQKNRTGHIHQDYRENMGSAALINFVDGTCSPLFRLPMPGLIYVPERGGYVPYGGLVLGYDAMEQIMREKPLAKVGRRRLQSVMKFAQAVSHSMSEPVAVADAGDAKQLVKSLEEAYNVYGYETVEAYIITEWTRLTAECQPHVNELVDTLANSRHQNYAEDCFNLFVMYPKSFRIISRYWNKLTPKNKVYQLWSPKPVVRSALNVQLSEDDFQYLREDAHHPTSFPQMYQVIRVMYDKIEELVIEHFNGGE